MSKIQYNNNMSNNITGTALYPKCRICYDIATHTAYNNHYCKPCYKYKMVLVRSNIRYYKDAIKRLG